jgi:hypothetical protein
MPVHDWTRVDDGTYHGFHGAWITHLAEVMNSDVLPKGYYALPEQHALEYVADVLTLQSADESPTGPAPTGGVCVLDAPPKVSRRLQMQPPYDMLRKTLAIRRTTGHRIVALIEILSPGNKSSQGKVEQFVEKATDAIRHGCHFLMVDLHPPTKFAPRGMHGAIWRQWFDAQYDLPKSQPLTLSSYESLGRDPVAAWVEHLAVGDPLIDMPLFLREDYYVNIPLQPTYDQAFRGLPEIFRAALEKPANGKRRKR